MPERHATMLEELVAAGRGFFGIVVGDKRAPGFFDFSRRGLAGSVIVLLVVTAIVAYLPRILTAEPPSGTWRLSSGNAAIFAVISYALVYALCGLLFRQIRRPEVYLPFLVTSNWASVFISVIAIASLAAGIDSIFLELVLVGLLLLVLINIARLVLTLRAGQIALLIAAHVVAGSLSLIILVAFFIPPDVLQQMLADAQAGAQ